MNSIRLSITEQLARAGAAWRRANTTARAGVAGALVIVLIGGTVLAVSEEAQRLFSESTGLSVVSGSPTISPYSGEIGVSANEWFMRASDNAIWGRKKSGSSWSWESLRGGLESAPAVTDDGIWMFAKAGDQAIWYRQRTGTTWGAWLSIGGAWTSSPAVERWNNNLYVFARGTDNALWYRVLLDMSVWNTWTSIGGAFTSAPAVALLPELNRLYVFARGTDNAIWDRYLGATGGWSGLESLGGVNTSSPAATASSYTDFQGNRRYFLYVIARGTDNRFWYRILRPTGCTGSCWDQWYSIPAGTFSSGPGAIEDPYGGPEILIYGRGEDSRVYKATGGVCIGAAQQSCYDKWTSWNVAP